MLNGKKILSVCGAVALLLGVGMNLRHSLNDYGMGTNSLSTFALAQIVVNPGASGSISIGQEGVIAYKGIVWECYDGWNPFCSKDCRAK